MLLGHIIVLVFLPLGFPGDSGRIHINELKKKNNNNKHDPLLGQASLTSDMDISNTKQTDELILMRIIFLCNSKQFPNAALKTITPMRVSFCYYV